MAKTPSRRSLFCAWCDCIIHFAHQNASPLGHCKLVEVVSRLMKSAGFPVYFTNRSLRAIVTTRLFDAQVDEVTIMEHTGHRSTDGVRAYKRTSDKLKELSSNVLNQSSTKKLWKEGGSEVVVADTVKLDLARVEPENVKPACFPAWLYRSVQLYCSWDELWECSLSTLTMDTN